MDIKLTHWWVNFKTLADFCARDARMWSCMANLYVLNFTHTNEEESIQSGVAPCCMRVAPRQKKSRPISSILITHDPSAEVQ